MKKKERDREVNSKWQLTSAFSENIELVVGQCKPMNRYYYEEINFVIYSQKRQ